MRNEKRAAGGSSLFSKFSDHLVEILFILLILSQIDFRARTNCILTAKNTNSFTASLDRFDESDPGVSFWWNSVEPIGFHEPLRGAL
jgi:hypothetical protein